jgi:hypothetical protein
VTDSTDSRADRARASKRPTARRSDGGRAGIRHRRRKRLSRRTVTTISVVAGVIVLLALAGGWVGIRALNAKSDLTKAQTLVSTIKTQATKMDFAGLGTTSKQLSAATSSAVAQTHDPLWRAAEVLPFIGKDLSAVRQMAEAIDSVSVNTLAPVAKVASGLNVASLKPVNGKFNLAPIVALNSVLGPAATSLHSASTAVSDIDLNGTMGVVHSAGVKLAGMLTSADTMVADIRSITSIAPAMLGTSGPRTYVLIFQNLAETTALGGTAAALSEVTVNDGAISMGRQASSANFPWQDGRPVIPVDPNLSNLFNSVFYTRLNLATSRPDFPTAAEITQAFWKEDIGGTIDGVISIDPVALAHILAATGPVSMSTGDTLTSANAVSLLLNQIYFRYSAPKDIPKTDAFFAEAAKAMFTGLLTSKADPKALLQAVTQGVTEHRIMVWSSHPDEQKVIAGTALSGVLPTDNTTSTTTGVFFRDMSASKMDYYLHTSANLTTDVCTAATPTFTTTVNLHSNLTTAQAAKLPFYVASQEWGAKQFETQVFVYGPPGTTFASAKINIAGVSTTLGGTTNDLGRPVAWFWVMLAPGQSSTLTATFTGPKGTYAAPALRTTPMLNPTTVTVEPASCASKK